MRTARAKQAALLLGFGLGAFFEAILMHPLVGLFYLMLWALCIAGVVLLWAAVRGPGPLPSGRGFAAFFLLEGALFNMLEGVIRHDLAAEWLPCGSGLGFALLGAIWSRMRDEHVIKRKSGRDRRCGCAV